jgi:uncharacterized membrane protein
MQYLKYQAKKKSRLSPCSKKKSMLTSPVPTLLADLKIAIEASEDAAEKANLIPGTDKVFDVLEAIVAGTKPFWALIGGLFHKHAAATAAAEGTAAPVGE